MPLGKLTKEEDLTQQSSPTPEQEELERLRAAEAQWKDQEAERQKQEADARIRALEDQMRQRYQAVRQNAAPPQEQTYAAQQELGLTDEEILANPKEAIERMAQHIAQKELAAERQQMTQILGHQVRRGFDAEMGSLSQEPYFRDLEATLHEYFQQNPQEAIVAGSVKRKYNELVGENLAYLTKLAAERQAAEAVAQERETATQAQSVQNRVVEPQIRPGSVEKTKTSEKEFSLDPNPARAKEKQRLIDEFNRHGANLDEKEWIEIEEGRALPKKMSADIQLGYGGPNVEY